LDKFGFSGKFGRVARPFVFFLLPNMRDWITPFQYVNAEELVWLYRVADSFGFKRVVVLISLPFPGQ